MTIIFMARFVIVRGHYRKGNWVKEHTRRIKGKAPKIGIVKTPLTAGGADWPTKEQANELAKGLAADANAKEKQVSPVLVGAVEQSGGKMGKFEFRLKKEVDISQKVDRLIDEGFRDLRECVTRDMDDNLRYTAVFDEDNYTAGFNNVSKQLKDAGWTMTKSKNTWGKPEGYNRYVNTLWSKEGTTFELQFHTKESWSKNWPSHEIYKWTRNPVLEKQKPKLIKMLRKRSEKLWSGTPKPNGWDTIPQMKNQKQAGWKPAEWPEGYREKFGKIVFPD